MALTRYKLGELLKTIYRTNDDLQYGGDNVRGVNNKKELIRTKADINGRDLSKFSIVLPGEFFFNHRTSRNGARFSITYNYENDPIIVTEDYVIFDIERKDLLLREWLYMFMRRDELDRYVITNSWGSSTEFFNWEDLCNVDVDLPPLFMQQKYVNIYNSMLANQQNYKSGLDRFKQAYEALVDEYKHTAAKIMVGSILQEVDCRNTEGKITTVQGINISKQFMPSVANTAGVDLSKYKIVKKGQFAFSGMQTGRDECIRIALHNQDDPIIISPAYTVLELKADSVLAEYVMMWFSRKEVDRLGWFMSDASIRTNLDLDRFYEIEIPVPELSAQQAIVDIYNVYNARREIGEKLSAQLKDICPILIKGSIEEAAKEA